MRMKTLPLAIALALSATQFVQAEEQAAAAKASDAASADETQKVIVVGTGSRGSQRTMIDTPVPVDILSTKELEKTGQMSLDKALQFRVPSFNTVQTPVNDATSLLDPYEIRNMGPSRVLVLINGKRKNASALLYTQTSPGRGETGADISAIPQDAIKRIEVLRDGASAQYGSDAIAGVVNIILKDTANGGSLTARAGVTGEGDGKSGGLSLNHGVALGDSGFVNYSIDVSKVGLSSRSGKIDPLGEVYNLGGDLETEVKPFLAKYPDARNVNGSPATDAAKFLVNSRYSLDGGVSIYGNAAYIHKTVDSYANYRTPYWRPTDYGLLHPAGSPYEGYGPLFLGTLDDYNATVGTKFTVGGWDGDLSLTTGGNKQMYDVTQSINRSMMEKRAANPALPVSPTEFDAGGSEFKHYVLNADFSQQMTPEMNVYVGTELRHESYELIAGDAASYSGSGADSYAGNKPEDSHLWSRNNYGVYFGSTYDVSKQLVFDATGRFEKYSDFGNATVWKLSSRYKVNDAITLRGSLSTGFRAPSLHQIYTQKDQYSFSGGTIKVETLINNVSSDARTLEVPLLKPEKSTNITLGLGLRPDADTSLTVDYYHINLKDRIILGNKLGATGTATNGIDTVLAKHEGAVALQFFSNALDSETSGIDYVFSRKNLSALGGKLGVNLSGNYSLKNERDGDIKNAPSVAEAGKSVLNDTQEALMFTSRPKYKTILGFDLDYQKMNFSMNNTVFGPTKFRNADIDFANLAVEFKTKTVTDLAMNYQLNDKMTLAFNINNVFNTVPEWQFKALTPAGQALLDSTTVNPDTGMTPRQEQASLATFANRYPLVTYDGSHFSQLGRTFAMSFNMRF